VLRFRPEGSKKEVEEGMRLNAVEEKDGDGPKESVATAGGHMAAPSIPSSATARPKSTILTPICLGLDCRSPVILITKMFDGFRSEKGWEI